MSSVGIDQESITVKRRQPKGLYILFFSELWERFSFYGIRALLILYMTKELMLSDHRAYGIYGAYGAMVYGATLIGGYLADHFTGSRYMVFIGSIIIAIGHFSMVLLPAQHFTDEHIMFISLSLIVVGTGFFKGNIAAMVGQLYEKNDEIRDSGYTLFYMGINIGHFLAPIVCGHIGETYGWHYGFSLAGIGMTAGSIIIYLGREHLPSDSSAPAKENIKDSTWLDLTIKIIILMGALLAIPVFAYIINHSELSSVVLNVFGVISLVIVAYFIKSSNPEERKCLLTLLVMLPFVTSFFACFEQYGSSVLLFTDRHIDRYIFGYQIPTSTLQSINPIFIVILAPITVQLWKWLAKRNMNPLAPSKFSLGLLQAGLGFGALLIAIRSADATGMISIWWLVLAMFLHTTGELCISPVGLSMVSKISPARFVGFMMGCFYLSLAFAHLIAAAVAKVASSSQNFGPNSDMTASLNGFYHSYEILFYFPVATSIIMLLIAPLFKDIFERHR